MVKETIVDSMEENLEDLNVLTQICNQVHYQNMKQNSLDYDTHMAGGAVLSSKNNNK